jgi:tetratricopeptide (TPR) repeat protein
LAVLRLLKALVDRLAKLPFFRVRLQRMTWYYGRDRKPSMADSDKVFLIMSSIWAAIRPIRSIDQRYIRANELVSRRTIREVAEDYDAAGILPQGTFNLLADPTMQSDVADLAKAEELLLEAIKDAPDFAEAHLTLAAVLLTRGDRKAALVQYLLAAGGRAQVVGNSVGSTVNAEAYHAAGVLLAEEGLLREAELCLRRAVDADDASPAAQLAYARVLAARGQLASAARHMRLSLSGRVA